MEGKIRRTPDDVELGGGWSMSEEETNNVHRTGEGKVGEPEMWTQDWGGEGHWGVWLWAWSPRKKSAWTHICPGAKHKSWESLWWGQLCRHHPVSKLGSVLVDFPLPSIFSLASSTNLTVGFNGTNSSSQSHLPREQTAGSWVPTPPGGGGWQTRHTTERLSIPFPYSLTLLDAYTYFFILQK